MQRAMPILGIDLTNPFASVNHISAGNSVGEIAYPVFNENWDSKPVSVMACCYLLNTFVILFVFLIILIGNTLF